MRYDVRVSGNRISGDANWYYSQKNGKTIFAVYSTVDIDDPTILYASRDEKAIVDMEYFVEEWKEYVNGAD